MASGLVIKTHSLIPRRSPFMQHYLNSKRTDLAAKPSQGGLFDSHCTIR